MSGIADRQIARAFVRATLAPAVALAAGVATAEAEATSEVLFTHKAWEVRVVGLDDGSVSCVAQVSDGARAFSLWSDAQQLVSLQFYDESWDMGEGETADLQLQIDRRPVWSLSNAELYKQSVFFNIPDSSDGVNFMNEVMAGNVLYLGNADGTSVESYSLAGSRAAIGAMIDCVGALGADANPFN